MRASLKRIRHPLANFEGEITVGGEKTAAAEEIKLTFDYYPTMQGASQEVLTKTPQASSSTNGNGTNGKDGQGNRTPPSRISTPQSSRDPGKTLAD